MSTVLVVDDEPDVLFTVRIALEVAGYDVIGAETGQRALELVWDYPDAIVLDLRLPDMDGSEVLKAIKAEPALSMIPVMCLSAHSDSSTKERMLALGATAYISKPFDLAELRSTVRMLLETRNAS
jgi:two-component system KDP operon response regulator KdpE